jgi:hypothetical protein
LPLGGHSNCLPCVPKRPFSVATNRWSFPHITVASRLILRIFVAPARHNSNGPFMSVPSPPRNEMLCFMRKPAKSLPNLLQLQEFPVPNKPLVILFVATCWLR